MKNFIFKTCCFLALFLMLGVSVFSKTNNVLNSEQTSQEKIFKIYFRDIVIDDAETVRIINAYQEKMYIKTCTKSTADGFVIFTIKTEDLIDKQMILTVLKGLGYTLDKEGKVSLMQE